MIILRIILAIIAIPAMLFFYILKGLFYLLTMLGAKIVMFIGGLMVLGGVVIIVVELLGAAAMGSNGMVGSSIGLIAGGVGVIAIPYASAFLSELFGAIADWIRDTAFHR